MGSADPGNTMRERVGSRGDRIRLYVLLNVDRLAFAGALTAGMFACFVAAGTYSPFRQFMLSQGPTRYMFQALVGALVTGVTLVVTINQLVISQELGPLGDQRKRMADSMGFRGDVEDAIEGTSPPEPESFLRALIDDSRERAAEFRRAVEDNPNDDLRDDVREFTDSLTDNADAVTDQLQDRAFGEYEVVKAALDYNYSWKIYRARRLRDTYEADLDEEERRALVGLIKVLTFFGPAREFIKSLYFQWELVDLSRNIVYTAIPALAVTGTLAVYLAPTAFPGTTLGVANLVWVVSAGVTAGLVPFFVLSAYVLRLATIAKRTLAIGPFILRGSERDDGDE